MAIYTQKCEQEWLKMNNRWGWNKDVLGGKKSKILTIGGAGGEGGNETSCVRLKKLNYTTSEKVNKRKQKSFVVNIKFCCWQNVHKKLLIMLFFGFS